MEEVMAFESLNAYKIMWLFVVFDLPVTEEEDRKRAGRFRKDLLKDGFTMMQFSVYIRHCASKEAMETHIKRVERFVPPKGKVSMVYITDKQYGEIRNFWAKKEIPSKNKPVQLELF
jgi:CRISPR-associated protein Cas2